MSCIEDLFTTYRDYDILMNRLNQTREGTKRPVNIITEFVIFVIAAKRKDAA